MQLYRLNYLLAITAVILLYGCKHEPFEPANEDHGYPEEIGNIMLNQCATSGCHNDISKAAAGGLSLMSWDKMFEGSRAGSSVIPFRPDQSFMMFFLNTDTNRGVVLSPTMPFNGEILNNEDYDRIHDWI